MISIGLWAPVPVISSGFVGLVVPIPNLPEVSITAWVVLPCINSISPEPPPRLDFNFNPLLPAIVITPEPAEEPIVLLPLNVSPPLSIAAISALPT